MTIAFLMYRSPVEDCTQVFVIRQVLARFHQIWSINQRVAIDRRNHNVTSSGVWIVVRGLHPSGTFTGLARRVQLVDDALGRIPCIMSGSSGSHPFLKRAQALSPHRSTYNRRPTLPFRSDAFASFLSCERHIPTSSQNAGKVHGELKEICV